MRNNTNRLLSYLLEILKMMTEAGAEIYRVEESAQYICRAYGMKSVDVYATTSNIIVSVEVEDGLIKTHTKRVGRISTDTERVDRLNALARRICSERLSDDDIHNEIEKIKETKTYSMALVLSCYALMAGMFYLFFGGRSLSETLVAIFIGFGVGVISFALSAINANNLLSKFICSFFVCLVAFAAYKFGLVQTVDFIIIGNIMALIPGIGITNAIRDLLIGDSVSGTIRIVEVALLALSIGCGYIVTSFLFPSLVLTPGVVNTSPLVNAVIEVVTATVFTWCFGILFNIRGNKLWIAAFSGFLAWGLFLLLGLFIENEGARYLIVSITTTAFSEIMARVLKTPASTFCMIALLPLVPGGALYYTMTGALSGNFGVFLSKAVYTIELAVALALGVVIVISLDRYITYVIRKAREKKAIKNNK